MSPRTLLRFTLSVGLCTIPLVAQVDPSTVLSPEAKAKAGAHTRELIEKAPKLPLVEKEFVLQAPTPGLEVGMVSWATLDGKGNIYMIQRGEKADPIIVADMNGKVLRSWGKGMYKIPHAIRLDPQGNVWTTDAQASVVYKFSPTGEKLLTIEVGGQPQTRSPFNGTTDIAFARNHVFITDGYGNARVLEYTLDGQKLKEWGAHGIGPGQFNLPHSIQIDGNTLYVADRENGRIQYFDLDGNFKGEFPVGKAYSITLANGALYAAMHPVDLPTASPGWLVKLDKKTGKILGYVEMPEKSGLHTVSATKDGSLISTYTNHVVIYRKQ